MSETEANKKNTSQPFSISSNTAWASMNALLDEKMPALPVEEKKNHKIFILFPILAAAVVFSFFVITTYKTTPHHSNNNGNPFLKPVGKAALYNSGKNISHTGIARNNTPAHGISSTANNSNHNAGKKYPLNTHTKTRLHDIVKTNEIAENSLPVRHVIEKINPVSFNKYAALQQDKKPDINIARLSNKNVITGSADTTTKEIGTQQEIQEQQKNQLEWMAGAGIERGLKNKDLAGYLTSKIMLPLSGKFSIGAGLVLLNGNGNVASEDVYTRSFATNPTVVKNVNKTTTFRNFTYISVPVQLVYKIKPSLYIGAGFQNSFLIKHKETENVELYDVNMSFLATYPTTAVDVGTISIRQIEPATRVTKYDPRILGTVGYSYKKWRLEINNEQGIKNAIEPADHYSSYSTGKTQTLGASLFYNIK